ncbi:hypothetical protein SFRURICE_004264 [Spodoptera frugiperda]|nr:hypothetical protein SFRURICE_004264 [Spodoptera frugiperda]
MSHVWLMLGNGANMWCAAPPSHLQLNAHATEVLAFFMEQTCHNLPNRCNSCKPGSTLDTTMKTPEH